MTAQIRELGKSLHVILELEGTKRGIEYFDLCTSISFPHPRGLTGPYGVTDDYGNFQYSVLTTTLQRREMRKKAWQQVVQGGL